MEKRKLGPLKPCIQDRWIWLTCDDCDMEHKLQLRCKVSEIRQGSFCKGCSDRRRRKLIYKAMNRYVQVKKPGDKFVLWTLGTSLLDTEENLKLIKKYWSQFRKKFHKYYRAKYEKWEPLVYCIEPGSEGRRLHLHIVVRGFAYQKFVLKLWRGITKEKSNVNFETSHTKATSAENAFRYVAKYVAKGYSYYWLGAMRKVRETPFKLNVLNKKHKIDQMTYDEGWGLQHQKTLEESLNER